MNERTNEVNITSGAVEISSAGKHADQRWQEIPAKYDVTNMHLNERDAMAQELLDSNLISEVNSNQIDILQRLAGSH